MSADADVQTRVDLDENAVTVTQRREIGELFDEYGELRLWYHRRFSLSWSTDKRACRVYWSPSVALW
jgi:hypothetical protein